MSMQQDYFNFSIDFYLASGINKTLDRYLNRHGKMPENIDNFINTYETRGSWAAITMAH